VAGRAAAAGELPYASVLVDAAGTVLASEHNTVTSSGDITAHPELKLARLAAYTYTATQRAELTLYTSCQPCVMCTNVIARAGLGRVVYALSTEHLHQLQPSGLPRPDAAPVRYDGPAPLAEAGQPIRDHYQGEAIRASTAAATVGQEQPGRHKERTSR
jgi:hypothetical protein